MQLQLSAQERVFGREAVEAALSVLALSRRGLPEAELSEVNKSLCVVVNDAWAFLCACMCKVF